MSDGLDGLALPSLGISVERMFFNSGNIIPNDGYFSPLIISVLSRNDLRITINSSTIISSSVGDLHDYQANGSYSLLLLYESG